MRPIYVLAYSLVHLHTHIHSLSHIHTHKERLQHFKSTALLLFSCLADQCHSLKQRQQHSQRDPLHQYHNQQGKYKISYFNLTIYVISP